MTGAGLFRAGPLSSCKLRDRDHPRPVGWTNPTLDEVAHLDEADRRDHLVVQSAARRLLAGGSRTNRPGLVDHDVVRVAVVLNHDAQHRHQFVANQHGAFPLRRAL